jgi:hypothetical protein
MFNFGEFLSTIVILNGEFLLKKAAIYRVKKEKLLVWTFTKKEIYLNNSFLVSFILV